MEYPAQGLYLHLDLGVRGTDGHMAYRTMPAPSSPDPSPRNGLRQDPALNLCHDGLMENAHRFPPLACWRPPKRFGQPPSTRPSCELSGVPGRLHLPSLDPHVVLDGLHARDPACDLDRLVDVRLRPDEAAKLIHALKRFDIAILRPAVGRLPPRHSGGAGPVGPATCANERNPTLHHRVGRSPEGQSPRFPYVITSHH